MSESFFNEVLSSASRTIGNLLRNSYSIPEWMKVADILLTKISDNRQTVAEHRKKFDSWVDKDYDTPFISLQKIYQEKEHYKLIASCVRALLGIATNVVIKPIAKQHNVGKNRYNIGFATINPSQDVPPKDSISVLYATTAGYVTSSTKVPGLDGFMAFVAACGAVLDWRNEIKREEAQACEKLKKRQYADSVLELFSSLNELENISCDQIEKDLQACTSNSQHTSRARISSQSSEFSLIAIFGMSMAEVVENFQVDDPSYYKNLTQAEWWWYGPKAQADNRKPPIPDTSNPSSYWLRLDFRKHPESHEPLPSKIASFIQLSDLIEKLKDIEHPSITVSINGHGRFDLAEGKLVDYVRR